MQESICTNLYKYHYIKLHIDVQIHSMKSLCKPVWIIIDIIRWTSKNWIPSYFDTLKNISVTPT